MKTLKTLLLTTSMAFIVTQTQAWPWSSTPNDDLESAFKTGTADKIADAEKAIQNGANLNKTKNIITGRPINMPYYVNANYLMNAAYEGRVEYVDLFLKHNADPNKANDRGMTALYFASSYPSWPINLGLNPRLRYDQMYAKENLQDSSKYGSAGDYLSKASSFLESDRLPRKLNVVKQLIKHGAHIDAKDDRGMTPLMAAISGSMKNIAEELINNGANVNATDNEGKTPIMFAVYNNQNAELVEYLLQKGADISVPVAKGQFAGLYPLDLAKLADHPNKYNYIRLLDKAAQNLKTVTESPKLHEAIERKTKGKRSLPGNRVDENQLPLWLNQEETH